MGENGEGKDWNLGWRGEKERFEESKGILGSQEYVEFVKICAILNNVINIVFNITILKL